MLHSFGASVLSPFDVHEEAANFLSDLIDSSYTPADELKRLLDASFLANSDDFHHLISCATAIQQSYPRDPNGLEGDDVLTFIWRILDGRSCAPVAQPAPWAETDRLIAVARGLAENPPFIRRPPTDKRQIDVIPVRKRHRRPTSVLLSDSKSHYWSEEKSVSGRQSNKDECTDGQASCRPGRVDRAGRSGSDFNLGIARQSDGNCSHSKDMPSLVDKSSDTRAQRPSSSSSSYFAPAIGENKAPKRKLAGIVSSVPFPPLACPHFGLIQEKMAHEPFWLLIAVTFLIKTNGQAAVPVFYKVKERFPSPKQLADPSNAEELLSMIRHLGLATNRLRFIQNYATRFLENPPMAGTWHKVKNYDERDDPSGCGGGSMEAWEIGHMTQGKYTLDSWRIFCRDKLLGRAQDWDGKGREPDFQPEWMRVTPQDKELRAYLRWMWMREGWEWDPVTGERSILRPELQLAVDEHRVEYDDQGRLRILDLSRQAPCLRAPG